MLYFANFTYRSKIESTLLCSTSSSATFLFRPLVYLSTLLVCCKRLAHRWEEDNQNSYFVNLKDFFTWQVVIIDLFISLCITLFLNNFWVWFDLSKEYICNKLLGMASLLSTVTFSVVRLIIMKSKTNAWVGRCEFSFKNTVALQLIWFLALTFSVPPLFYFGRYGKNMVGIR